MRLHLRTAALIAAAAVLAACSNGSTGSAGRQAASRSTPTPSRTSASPTPTPTVTTVTEARGLPGMPPLLNPNDIYAADRAGDLSPVVRGFKSLVYVPNSESATVDVIDPKTYRLVDHFAVGRLPQHVTPSYDLKTLYVLNDLGNTVTVIDPRTGRPGRTIPVTDPYNMYFTPDGKYAIVVAERLQRLDFRDAHTMKLVHSLSVDCRGVDHADFTADGRFAIFSCEFSGKLVKIDVAKQSIVGYLHVKEGGSPQDVKTAPDGKVMYVADQYANGLQVIDPVSFKEIGFIPTGRGTHGLYVNRESTWLYATNRLEGSVSIIDLAKRKAIAKWWIPGGGSPDMGGVSADGKVLWLTGRYNGQVYAIDAHTGKLLARIAVGSGPHGLCVYPQPGRYSLGHTGVFR
jgi:DNA-binding beta-propeller fold protein YncE